MLYWPLIRISETSKGAQRPYELCTRALDSNFPEALVALGRVRMESKRYDEAIQLLQRAIQHTLESKRYRCACIYNSGRAAATR